MSRLTLSLLILALLACPLAAADARLAGPVSGFFFDAGSHSLRPMIGVPGSSWLGDPLAAELDYAAMAPNGKAALAARAGRLYLVAGLDRFELQWNELGAALEGLDRIAWSADSSAAVVANSATGRLQRWSKLNTAPESADPLELAGRLLALVLDETGGTAVAGVADSGVYLLTAGSVRQISRMVQPVSLALAGNDLYVANRAASEILAIRDYTSGGDATLFANESMGVQDPVGVALSADGKSLVVASAAGKSLSLFDLTAAATPRKLDLDFMPSRIDRFAGAALYVLNDGGAEPFQLLDSGTAMNVYFVPAGTRED